MVLHCWAGLGRWASSKDPILQRYGVGALSRVATSSPRAFGAVVDSSCLPALVAATASDDAQAQCFAAGAIGVCLSWLVLGRDFRHLPALPACCVAVTVQDAFRPGEVGEISCTCLAAGLMKLIMLQSALADSLLCCVCRKACGLWRTACPIAAQSQCAVSPISDARCLQIRIACEFAWSWRSF